MKCHKCGFENKDSAKFCSKCGVSLEVAPPPVEEKNNNSKMIIAVLMVIIVLLAVSIGYFAFTNNALGSSSQVLPTSGSSDNHSTGGSSGSSQEVNTTQTSSSSTPSKDWVLIGSYTGSGSGTRTINVPAGDIRVDISAFPIKNYATNHLYVSGTNGKSCGVDWGSNSAVETRSDSLSYSSSSPVTFTIDYYETVSWQVDFYRYQ